MAAFEDRRRAPEDTCWQCGKHIRSAEQICVWCGATRLPPEMHQRLWKPAQQHMDVPGGGYSNGWDQHNSHAATGVDPAAPRNDSPLGIPIPMTENLPAVPFAPQPQPPAPHAQPHPYQQPGYYPVEPQQDWRRTPPAAPSYVPRPDPHPWTGNLAGASDTSWAEPAEPQDDPVLDEDTQEHPRLPRHAPPMNPNLGHVRLVQQDSSAPRKAERGGQPEPVPGPPDRGLRYGRRDDPSHDHWQAPTPGAVGAQGWQVLPPAQPPHADSRAAPYAPPPSGYWQEPPADYPGSPTSSYGPDVDGAYGPMYPGGWSAEAGYGYSSAPDYGYAYGYPQQPEAEEAPAGRIQELVDWVWDEVHAEEALAWIEAKVQRALGRAQQFQMAAERMAPEQNTTARRMLNILSPVGLGCVGGFIGGVIWYILAASLHFEIGLFAMPMAYLIGSGVAMGSLRRGLLPPVLAVLVTLACWSICITIIGHSGLNVTPVEIVFLLVTLAVAVVPTRAMKRERWERRY